MRRAAKGKSDYEEMEERLAEMGLDRKKAFLAEYRVLDQRVRRLEEEIARWESLGRKVTASYSKAPGGGGAERISSSVEEVDLLLEGLREELGPLAARRRQIEDAIKAVNVPKQALLLRYYYVDGLTLEEVAEKLGLGYTWTWQLRNRALNAIILPDCMEVNTEKG